MPTIPQTISGRLEFFEQHLPVWAADPAAIGLAAADVASLAAVTAQARTDYNAALASRDAAKAKTELQNITVGVMTSIGGDFVNTIRDFAEKTNNPAVYTIAQIPAPADPTPAGPPVQPTELTASLLTTGGLKLSWNGSVANGTYFSVFRRVDNEQGFTMLDAPKAKTFDDTTIPTGANQIFYYVQARRDNFMVNSAQLSINFTANGGMNFSTLSLAA